MSNTAIQSTYAPPSVLGAAPVSDIPQGLEMATVLGIVTTKYDNLTKMFNDAMDVEKKRQANLTLVHQAKQEMASYAGRSVDPNTDGTGPHQALRDAAGRAADDLKAAGYPDTDPTVVLLRGIQNNQNAISSTDTSGASTGLDDKTQTLSSDSQLNMLTLQDTMSKVQTLMSMATNLEATIHDMQKGIVANMHV